MKIIRFLLFWVVMVTTDCMDTRTEVNSSHLESKLFEEESAKVRGHDYMASLQLDGKHICSSGLFKVGFLLTTGECAWNIENGMTHEHKKATAVLGNNNLRDGQKIDILKIVLHPQFRINYPSRSNNYCDYGIAMLADNVNDMLIKPLELYQKKINVRSMRPESTLCGWGSVTKIEEEEDNIMNAEHSDYLHCMTVHLLAPKTCNSVTAHGNYRDSLLCGQGESPLQTISMGDVGSPLTKTIFENFEHKEYIIGMTLHSFEFQGCKFQRFIRASSILKDLEKMIEMSQTQTTLKPDCGNATQLNFKENRNKRRKIIN